MSRNRVDLLPVTRICTRCTQAGRGDRIDDRVDGEELGAVSPRVTVETPLRSTKASPLSVT